MKAHAPNGNGTGWTLRLTDEEYGRLSPEALKRLKMLTVTPVKNGRTGESILEFWGQQHLELGIEVGRHEGLLLEK